MDNDLLILTHGGERPEDSFGAVVPPVFMNSLHLFKTFEDYSAVDALEEGQYIYGRNGNPTTHLLEKKICALERGARAAAFGSGMAAFTTALMATCRAGSHIICMRDSYQPVKRFLDTVCIPGLNMAVTYLTGTDLAELEAAIRPETSLIIIESPATFVFTIVDIRSIARIARKHGVRTYMDNSCCTPLFQKPLEMGMDIVMHTMSKYLGGHSDLIGGVLVSKDDELMKKILTNTREWFGGILGPMEAWLVIRGMRTLDARLRAHQETALKVAHYLQSHARVARVHYSGLSDHPQRELIASQQAGHTGLMSFELDAPPEATVRFINALQLFGKGCSWGGFESLALCPLFNARDEELRFLDMVGRRGLIRIHCGLEGADNLLEDLERAFSVI